MASNVTDFSNLNVNLTKNDPGISTSNKYVSQPMSLPNSRVAYPVPAEKIIEQISAIDKTDGRNGDYTIGQISCLDRKIIGALNAQIDLGTNGSSDSIYDIFPKDGPRQKSWLDIRDNLDRWLTEYHNIIEVGVITIPAKIIKK